MQQNSIHSCHPNCLITWLMVRCRWMVDAFSACTEMMSAPALTKSGMRRSGSTIICAQRRGQQDLKCRADAEVCRSRHAKFASSCRLLKWQTHEVAVKGLVGYWPQSLHD